MPSFEAVMAWNPSFVVQAVVSIVGALAIHKLLRLVYRKAKRAISDFIDSHSEEDLFAERYHRGPNGPLDVLGCLCLALAGTIFLWIGLIWVLAIIVFRPLESIIVTVSTMAFSVYLIYSLFFLLRVAFCAHQTIHRGNIRAEVCPECGHQFQGNGWHGIDAHWKSPRVGHEHIMPYKDAWPIIKAGGRPSDHTGSRYRGMIERLSVQNPGSEHED